MKQKRSTGRIFIHHDGALGDTLLSLPCIRRIREKATFVHVAARKDIADFLMSGGVVDETSSSDSALYSSLYADAPSEVVKRFLSGFDSAYVFSVNADSLLSATIRHEVQDTKTIVTIPPQGSSVHISEYRLRQCGFSVEKATEMEMLHISEEIMTYAYEFLEKTRFRNGQDFLITIHPGSGGKRKCWPWDQYDALIRMIMREPRFFVLVLSGPAEDRETVSLLSALGIHSDRIIHMHNEPLIRTASLLALSDFYLGNDSGISHLAGILQCRGIVLFGPTDPGLWRPPGDSLDVLRFDAAEHVCTVDAESILRRITCVFSCKDSRENGNGSCRTGNGGADGTRTRDLLRDRQAF